MTVASREKVTRHGSTVHVGGYDCECFGCALGEPANPARWSCWRISFRKIELAYRGKYARGSCVTWLMCDLCRAESERLPPEPSSMLVEREIYLPLLHPDDPYARIAVEEMLYALAALLGHVRERASRRFVIDVNQRRTADQWWRHRKGRP